MILFEVTVVFGVVVRTFVVVAGAFVGVVGFVVAGAFAVVVGTLLVVTGALVVVVVQGGAVVEVIAEQCTGPVLQYSQSFNGFFSSDNRIHCI